MQEQVQAALDAGQVTIRQARAMLATLGGDPDSLTITCEAKKCTNRVRFGDAHSFLSVYATTGPRLPTGEGVAAFQCEHQQHYGCSPECAAQAHARCVQEHLVPTLHAIHAGAMIVEQGRARAIAAPDASTMAEAAGE